MADVFISYAREDLKTAQLLANAIESHGWSVWWDRSSIHAGSNWREVIEDALAAAGCIIVAWSKNSVNKQFVIDEAQEGLERKILVPVFIEYVKPPLGFRQIQAESLIDWFGKLDHLGFTQLIEAVENTLNKSESKRWDEVYEKIQMEVELEIARELQISLLPSTCPIGQSFEIAAFSSSARQVGGDFYDFFEISENKTGLVIGDVTGKSVSGALVMSVPQYFPNAGRK